MTATVHVKVIRPKKMNDAAMFAVFANLAQDTEKGILQDFEDTTGTWKHKPKWTHGHSASAKEARAFAETGDEIYKYVNEGTKPHIIRPKGNWMLRFKWGGKGSYRPKTKPGRLGSRPGGPSGPEVRLPVVHHPGQKEPRKFDELLAKRWEGLLKRAANDAMRDAAKASGHAIA